MVWSTSILTYLVRAGTQWLKSIKLKSSDRLILDNFLMHLDSIKKQVARVDDEISIIASEDEYVKLLMNMTGMDVYTALLIRSEIGDISRFNNYKKLVASARLAPSLHQSGNTFYTSKNNQARLKDARVDNGRSIQSCC